MIYDISVVANGLVPDPCAVLDSKQRPLWIVLRNADPRGVVWVERVDEKTVFGEFPSYSLPMQRL